MARDDLKPVRSTEEAKARGKNGGIASGIARREKRTMRQLLEIALARKSEDGKETAEAVTVALIDKALAGDVKAYEVIRDTIGEKPVDKVEMTQVEQAIMDMTPEQRTQYAIKMLKDRGAL